MLAGGSGRAEGVTYCLLTYGTISGAYASHGRKVGQVVMFSFYGLGKKSFNA